MAILENIVKLLTLKYLTLLADQPLGEQYGFDPD